MKVLPVIKFELLIFLASITIQHGILQCLMKVRALKGAPNQVHVMWSAMPLKSEHTEDRYCISVCQSVPVIYVNRWCVSLDHNLSHTKKPLTVLGQHTFMINTTV